MTTLPSIPAWIAAALCLLCAPAVPAGDSPAAALTGIPTQPASTGAASGSVEEVLVTARRRPDPPPFASDVSISTRGIEDIARLQPANLFEVVRDVPGLSINGGPRASGMKFNIRGFSDTEDVNVELDGIVRGFEKYRFGSGVFIEPELLRRIDVERTPSIMSATGALGGTVRATTLDASDLLEPDQRLGTFLKSGYSSNDDGRLYAGALYGRPSATVDLLAFGSLRNSNDMTLPDGTHLADSATDSESLLLKSGWQPGERTLLSLAGTLWRDDGRQPYDATGGQPGFFGTVRRAIDDRTVVLGFHHASAAGPEDIRWLDLDLTTGFVDTTMDDRLAPGETPFSNAVTGTVRDDFRYRTGSLRVDNRIRVPGVLDNLFIALGGQYIDAERDISRVTENETINAALYPGGFNAAQPPGRKTALGLYAQPSLEWGRISLAAGGRWDRQAVEAQSGTAELLAAAGEPARITVSRFSPAASLSVAVIRNRLDVFYNFVEAFRPPLIDEYFTQGAFSRCNPALLGEFAPESRTCGELYVPEEAVTHEIGAGLTTVPLAGGTLDLKLTFFRTDVSHTLESLRVVAPGVIGQPGSEERHGTEFEASYLSDRWLVRIGYGEVSGDARVNGVETPLYDVPGDTTTVLVEYRWFDGALALGYRLEDVDSRQAMVGGTFASPVIGTQSGYHLQGAHLAWQAGEHAQVRLVGDNLGNETYRLNDGFGGAPGSEAPGRNVGVTLVLTF